MSKKEIIMDQFSAIPKYFQILENDNEIWFNEMIECMSNSMISKLENFMDYYSAIHKYFQILENDYEIFFNEMIEWMSDCMISQINGDHIV